MALPTMEVNGVAIFLVPNDPRNPFPQPTAPFNVADYLPEMTMLFINPIYYKRYASIRERYPGLYPSLELDIEISKYLYTNIRQHMIDNLDDPHKVYVLRLFLYYIRSFDYWKVFYYSAYKPERDDDDPASTPVHYEDMGKWYLFYQYLIWRQRRSPDTSIYGIPSNLQSAEYQNRNNVEWIAIDAEIRPSMDYLASLSWENLWDWVEQTMGQEGFVHNYFMFYNPASPHTATWTGKVPLKPNTFELATEASELATYPKALEQFKQGYDVYAFGRVNISYAPFVGWRNVDLQNAILDSGLVSGKSFNNGQLRSVTYKALGAVKPVDKRNNHPNGLYYTVKLKANGIEEVRSKRTELRKIVLHRLYRHVFSTIDYINWNELCRSELMSDETIKLLAADYILITKDVPRAEICQALDDISQKQRTFQQQLLEALPFQKQAVLLQPNNQWLAPFVQARFIDTGDIITDAYQQYLLIKDICGNDDIDVDGVVLRLKRAGMSHLIPGGYQNASKEQLCTRLLDVTAYQAEKYESVMFDCSDPAIRKRHIINSVLIMELSGIFKHIDMEKATKEDLCRIIDNYITMINEQRRARLVDDYDKEIVVPDVKFNAAFPQQ